MVRRRALLRTFETFLNRYSPQFTEKYPLSFYISPPTRTTKRIKRLKVARSASQVRPVRIAQTKTDISVMKYQVRVQLISCIEQKTWSYSKLIRNWSNNYVIKIVQMNTLLSFCTWHNPSQETFCPFLEHRTGNDRHSVAADCCWKGTIVLTSPSKMIFQNKMWCFLNQFMVFHC